MTTRSTVGTVLPEHFRGRATDPVQFAFVLEVKLSGRAQIVNANRGHRRARLAIALRLAKSARQKQALSVFTISFPLRLWVLKQDRKHANTVNHEIMHALGRIQILKTG